MTTLLRGVGGLVALAFAILFASFAWLLIHPESFGEVLFGILRAIVWAIVHTLPGLQ